jgi:hypothetical protein
MGPGNHVQQVREIARQTGCPEELVDGLYQEILRSLSIDAHVKDYLPVLTAKRVKTRLKEMQQGPLMH